ncbi:unnamed protein product [Durusdinium trenchii]|uniref:Uncharacterized protein n=1 Tax=Durusdinium trenchii TaxID=1381693 RepID=A0ABP0RYS2_9DINO
MRFRLFYVVSTVQLRRFVQCQYGTGLFDSGDRSGRDDACSELSVVVAQNRCAWAADARMMSLCAPICAVQAVQKLPEKVNVAMESLDLKPEQQASTTESESELDSISSEEPSKGSSSRAFEGWSGPLPVERTFIQFSTHAEGARRRCRSVF